MGREKIALVLPILVVLVSGCIQTGIGPIGTGSAGIKGKGIVINVFEPTLKSVRSNEELSLHLEVQNTGDYNNAPVVAELIGINPEEWNVYNPQIDLGELAAPDPETGTEGGTATGDWNLRAPLLKKGQVMDYEPIARIYYYYETYAVKPVWFVTSEELRRIVQRGGILSSEATQSTNAPVTVDIKTGNFIRASDWQNAKFSVQFKITNTGKGLIAGKDYPVWIDIEYPDGVSLEGTCPPQTGYSAEMPNIPISPPGFGTVVKLWDGKETTFTCQFRIIDAPASKELRNFKVKLGYIYYIDSGTNIQVVGQEEGFF